MSCPNRAGAGLPSGEGCGDEEAVLLPGRMASKESPRSLPRPGPGSRMGQRIVASKSASECPIPDSRSRQTAGWQLVPYWGLPRKQASCVPAHSSLLQQAARSDGCPCNVGIVEVINRDDFFTNHLQILLHIRCNFYNGSDFCFDVLATDVQQNYQSWYLLYYQVNGKMQLTLFHTHPFIPI